MATDLEKVAKDRKIKYFLISYVDLFGGLRAKLVPAAAIGAMQRDGAGFAGFATWLDMTPADPDLFAKPDPDEPDPVALEARGRLARQRPHHGRRGGRGLSAQDAEDPDRGRGQAGLPHEDRRRVRVLPARQRRQGHQRRRRQPGEALLRPAGPDAPISCDYRDLRQHARARLEALPERPRGRQRPVRDELGVRRLPEDRRPPRLLQVHGQGDRREARASGPPSCRSRSSTSPATAATPTSPSGTRPARTTCSTIARASSASPSWPTSSSAASSTTPRRSAPSSIRP